MVGKKQDSEVKGARESLLKNRGDATNGARMNLPKKQR